MVAASLIDTNVVVYRFDPRFPKKQAIATQLLREGLSTPESHFHRTSHLPGNAGLANVVPSPVCSRQPLLKTLKNSRTACRRQNRRLTPTRPEALSAGGGWPNHTKAI
jgi:hypothetical protein